MHKEEYKEFQQKLGEAVTLFKQFRLLMKEKEFSKIPTETMEAFNREYNKELHTIFESYEKISNLLQKLYIIEYPTRNDESINFLQELYNQIESKGESSDLCPQ